MSEPREYSTEEVQSMFLSHVWALVEDWERQDISERHKLEKLAFSILSTTDGSSLELPSFILAPCPHETDREFLIEEGENWFPENDEDLVNGNISGGLHELFYEHKPQLEK